MRFVVFTRGDRYALVHCFIYIYFQCLRCPPGHQLAATAIYFLYKRYVHKLFAAGQNEIS